MGTSVGGDEPAYRQRFSLRGIPCLGPARKLTLGLCLASDHGQHVESPERLSTRAIDGEDDADGEAERGYECRLPGH